MVWIVTLIVLAGSVACSGRRPAVQGTYACKPDGSVVYALGNTETPVVRPPSREDLCDRCRAFQQIVDGNQQVLDNPEATDRQKQQASQEIEVAKRHLEGCRNCRCEY